MKLMWWDIIIVVTFPILENIHNRFSQRSKPVWQVECEVILISLASRHYTLMWIITSWNAFYTNTFGSANILINWSFSHNFPLLGNPICSINFRHQWWWEWLLCHYYSKLFASSNQKHMAHRAQNYYGMGNSNSGKYSLYRTFFLDDSSS